MSKRIVILYNEPEPLIDALKHVFDGIENVVCLNNSKELKEDDFVILCGYKGYEKEALNIHYSLLPAFQTDNPIKDSIIYGAKVTGITIFYNKSKKIIAQYPVFIDKDDDYLTLTNKLSIIAQGIYPIAAKKIYNNEYFDINALENRCGTGCGGCKECKS